MKIAFTKSALVTFIWMLFLCILTFDSNATNKSELPKISLGVNIVSQRTQTLVFNEFASPYYSKWGTNFGLGLLGHYQINNKNIAFVSFNSMKLLNTIDITENNWFFYSGDKKKFKPIPIFWKSKELNIGIKHMFFSNKSFKFFYNFGISSNFGQLILDNFPSQTLQKDSLYKEIKFNNGEDATLIYKINSKSTKNMGFNILNGISIGYQLNKRINLYMNLLTNFGMVPLVASKINYKVKSNNSNLIVSGHNYMVSSNSGIRSSIDITFNLFR